MWSEWTECVGSCRSSRRRICSEQFGCEGFELEERDCTNADDVCFKSISDTLSEGVFFLKYELILILFLKTLNSVQCFKTQRI